MKKRTLSTILLSALLLAACGDEEATKETNASEATSTEKSEVKTTNKVIEQSDLQSLYTDPQNFKGDTYEFIGKVFVTPEKDEEGVYLQVWADYENSNLNTIVGFKDPNLQVNEGDYVKVSGIIEDSFEGENMLGGTVIAPVVIAEKLEVLDYATAVAPTIKTLEVNSIIEQNGFTANLEKIEFAEPHTRAYITVTNNSSNKVSFAGSSAKLISNNQQFEITYDYEANYPELPYEILPGVTASGILLFPTLSPETTDFQLHVNSYSENYEVNMEDFVFTSQ